MREAERRGERQSRHLSPLASLRQIDEVLDFSSNLVAGPNFEPMCVRLNDYLSLRTFFGDVDLSIADLCVWGTLQGGWMPGCDPAQMGRT